VLLLLLLLLLLLRPGEAKAEEGHGQRACPRGRRLSRLGTCTYKSKLLRWSEVGGKDAEQRGHLQFGGEQDDLRQEDVQREGPRGKVEQCAATGAPCGQGQRSDELSLSIPTPSGYALLCRGRCTREGVKWGVSGGAFSTLTPFPRGPHGSIRLTLETLTVRFCASGWTGRPCLTLGTLTLGWGQEGLLTLGTLTLRWTKRPC